MMCMKSLQNKQQKYSNKNILFEIIISNKVIKLSNNDYNKID